MLDRIKNLVIDEEVKNSRIAIRAKEFFEKNFSKTAKKKKFQDENKGLVLYLKNYKGNFLKPCPGTKNYNCCGYLILHTGEGCPIGCTYCILQAYFRDKILKVWANINTMFEELDRIFSNKNKRFRVGTGEFIDSLALEPATQYHREILTFLARYPNVCLEIKTKTDILTWMDAEIRIDRVLPAWSLNAISVQERYEGSSVSIERRLKAASFCQKIGFRICLHFDPILFFPDWERLYKEVITMMGDYLDPKKICYISLGSFRGMPRLFKIIQTQIPDADFVYNEFITGLDGKMRLLRPLRIKQFRFILEYLTRIGIKKNRIYLCMESDEVWNAVFGYTPEKFGGLNKHLLNLAFEA